MMTAGIVWRTLCLPTSGERCERAIPEELAVPGRDQTLAGTRQSRLAQHRRHYPNQPLMRSPMNSAANTLTLSC